MRRTTPLPARASREREGSRAGVNGGLPLPTRSGVRGPGRGGTLDRLNLNALWNCYLKKPFTFANILRWQNRRRYSATATDFFNDKKCNHDSVTGRR
jgi:hypothetical protein